MQKCQAEMKSFLIWYESSLFHSSVPLVGKMRTIHNRGLAQVIEYRLHVSMLELLSRTSNQ
jgi:hypothetical protein